MDSPLANKKVLAIPPPTINSSTFSANDFNIVSLVETLDPATMATKGRFGSAKARLRASNSAAINGPAQATFAKRAIP